MLLLGEVEALGDCEGEALELGDWLALGLVEALVLLLGDWLAEGLGDAELLELGLTLALGETEGETLELGATSSKNKWAKAVIPRPPVPLRTTRTIPLSISKVSETLLVGQSA